MTLAGICLIMVLSLWERFHTDAPVRRSNYFYILRVMQCDLQRQFCVFRYNHMHTHFRNTEIEGYICTIYGTTNIRFYLLILNSKNIYIFNVEGN